MTTPTAAVEGALARLGRSAGCSTCDCHGRAAARVRSVVERPRNADGTAAERRKRRTSTEVARHEEISAASASASAEGGRACLHGRGPTRSRERPLRRARRRRALAPAPRGGAVRSNRGRRPAAHRQTACSGARAGIDLVRGSSGGHVRVAPQRDPPPEAAGQRECPGLRTRAATGCASMCQRHLVGAPRNFPPSGRGRGAHFGTRPQRFVHTARGSDGVDTSDRVAASPIAAPAAPRTASASAFQPFPHRPFDRCGTSCTLGARCSVLGAHCWVPGAWCSLLSAGCRSSTPCRSCAAASRRHPEGPARRCRASGCRSGTRTHREVAHAIAGAGLPVRRYAAG
ncbi:hypothetical protein JO380_001714 [Cellulomonas iranensis]|uniref:LigA n=1 Tax=Cellulomonas iranensis TaxID=76862 RepID=A0ABU0GJS4_9CELL|nr:hypothetical protein [Cellulomonas iranensis]